MVNTLILFTTFIWKIEPDDKVGTSEPIHTNNAAVPLKLIQKACVLGSHLRRHILVTT
jgi:hypothetical protein